MRFDRHSYTTEWVTLPSLVVSNAYQHLIDYAIDLADDDSIGNEQMVRWIQQVLWGIDQEVTHSLGQEEIRWSIKRFTENSRINWKERMK